MNTFSNEARRGCLCVLHLGSVETPLALCASVSSVLGDLLFRVHYGNGSATVTAVSAYIREGKKSTLISFSWKQPEIS